MKKIRILQLALILLAIIGVPIGVFAHVTQSSGSIQATMHIDPGDDPSAGIPSRIEFIMNDLNHKFSIGNCNCSIIVGENGKQINAYNTQNSSQSILTTSGDTLSVPFVFPEPNVYEITIAGSSTQATFQPFSISFDTRVEKSGSQSTFLLLLIHHSFHLILFIIAIIIGIIFTVLDKLSEKKEKEKLQKKM